MWKAKPQTTYLCCLLLLLAMVNHHDASIGNKSERRQLEETFSSAPWSGAEFYHQAHKQFHPTYRAILYERNYYDIFIFDLQGAALVDGLMGFLQNPLELAIWERYFMGSFSTLADSCRAVFRTQATSSTLFTRTHTAVSRVALQMKNVGYLCINSHPHLHV